MVWQANEMVTYIKGYELVLRKYGGTRVIFENTVPEGALRPMLPTATIAIREFPRFNN